MAFNLCTQSPSSAMIRGAVLVAPMLKISDDMMIVPKSVIDFLKNVVIPCIPYAPLTPVKDILPACFKREETFRNAQQHSLHFDMKPRLGQNCLAAGLFMALPASKQPNKYKHE